MQGPPSSFVPYILTDAIRHYMQRRDSITNNKVEVDYWDRGLRMANLGWRLHGKQSEITSFDSFQNAVVDFLNEQNSTPDSQPTTKIMSALIFNQELIGAGGGEGNLLKETLTIKAAVFGQAALYARENYTSTLLSEFDENPDIFLGRLTGEQESFKTIDGFQVFAVEVPGVTNPTMSPVAIMDPVTMINTNILDTVKAQPNLSFILSAMLIVSCLLSSATGFAVSKRNQKRKLEEKEAVDGAPVSAPSPV